jgi:hypothetical protein
MVEAAGVSLSQPEQQNAAERAAGDRLPPLFPDDLTPSKAADVSSLGFSNHEKGLKIALVSEKTNGRWKKVSANSKTRPWRNGMLQAIHKSWLPETNWLCIFEAKVPDWRSALESLRYRKRFKRAKIIYTKTIFKILTLETVPDVISSSEFWLFSNHGVLYSSPDDAEFLTLAAWAEQYRKFKSLQKVKFFRNFKKIKAFHAWRQFSDGARVSLHRTLLSRNHILSEVELAQPILAVSSLFEEMKDLNFLPYLPKGWLFETFEKGKVGNIFILKHSICILISSKFNY